MEYSKSMYHANNSKIHHPIDQDELTFMQNWNFCIPNLIPLIKHYKLTQSPNLNQKSLINIQNTRSEQHWWISTLLQTNKTNRFAVRLCLMFQN